MSMGISVEFCIHIAVVFMRARGSRRQRVTVAMVKIGSAVIQGVLFTNIFPVIVLAFTPSDIFEIYYFRMYFGMILIAALHGLIWIPIALSIFGPKEGAGWICSPSKQKDAVQLASEQFVSDSSISPPQKRTDRRQSQSCSDGLLLCGK
eukprot:823325_1